jgi:hypothetical protein
LIWQTEKFVAEDIVRNAKAALELVECATWCHEIEHRVVAVVLFVDWVCKTTLAPPIW